MATDARAICATQWSAASSENARTLPIPAYPLNSPPSLFKQIGVSVFIVHVLDPSFREAFESAGIEVVTGSSGPTNRAVERFLATLFLGADMLDDDLSPNDDLDLAEA